MPNHMQVAHRWATRWEVNGRKLKSLTGFNMWSDGDSIFSYGRHFEIARYVDSSPMKKDAKDVPSRVVLFTRRDHSVSTAKHKTFTRRAIPSHVPVFDVIDLSGHDHASNFAAYETEASDLYAKSIRARTNTEWLAKRATAELDEAQAYAKAFGVKWKRPDLGELTVIIAKRVAAQAEQYNKERIERAKREALRMETLREEQAPAFKAWQNGEPMQYIPSAYNTDPLTGSAYLRRFGDELQTSQRASVPWEHALKAFKFIKLVRERGEGWKRNGHTIRVGHFMIDSIAPNGDFFAGCHFIAWDEVSRLALRENVFDVKPSTEAVIESTH